MAAAPCGLQLFAAVPRQLLAENRVDERVAKCITAPTLFEDAQRQRLIERIEQSRRTDRQLEPRGRGEQALERDLRGFGGRGQCEDATQGVVERAQLRGDEP